MPILHDENLHVSFYIAIAYACYTTNTITHSATNHSDANLKLSWLFKTSLLAAGMGIAFYLTFLNRSLDKKSFTNFFKNNAVKTKLISYLTKIMQNMLHVLAPLTVVYLVKLTDKNLFKIFQIPAPVNHEPKKIRQRKQ